MRKAWETLGRPATLLGLLESEVQAGMHRPGGRGEPRVLKDPSAAIALVWVRRSLAFQTSLLGTLAEDRASTLAAVAGEAYKSHLERYHTWILKSTFRMGLSAMPSRAEFLHRLTAGGLRGEALSEALPSEREREGVCYEEMAELAEVQARIVDEVGRLLVALQLERAS